MSSNANRDAARAEQLEEPSDNPTAPGDDIAVTLSVPERIQVRMVEATALSDYEILFLFSSFTFSGFVGCGVAALQADEKTRLPWFVITVFLLFLFLGFMAWTLKKRYLLTTKQSKVLHYQRQGRTRQRRPPKPRVPKGIEPPDEAQRLPEARSGDDDSPVESKD
jgi:hypothetical protein